MGSRGSIISERFMPSQKAGFWFLRPSGHVVMTNGTRVVTIPRANPINAYMAGIARDAGLSEDEFRQLL